MWVSGGFETHATQRNSTHNMAKSSASSPQTSVKPCVEGRPRRWTNAFRTAGLDSRGSQAGVSAAGVVIFYVIEGLKEDVIWREQDWEIVIEVARLAPHD